MKLPLYIAKRYLFAKKSKNAINVISGVSVAGVTIGTMALIIILSVFNGLEQMVTSIFNTFDPDLKITATEGKTFTADSTMLQALGAIEGVEACSVTIEENALLRYDDRQVIATIKGVDTDYDKVTGIKNAIWDGQYMLRNANGRPFCVMGAGIAQYLGMRINFINPLFIYVPDKSASSGRLSPEKSFHREFIYPSGIFQVEQSFDSKYVFLPLDFTRKLIGNADGISAIDVKTAEKANLNSIKKAAMKLFDNKINIRNRLEQQDIYYKVMKSERLAIFLILTLILIIASFNIVGSLTMLIIEKEHDIQVLRSLGADNQLIRKIFLLEGWLISILGAIAGIIAGFIICRLQQIYGFVKFSSDSLLIDSYPVTMKIKDFIIVPATVLFIGYWAAWFPVRSLSKKYFANENNNQQ